MNNLQQAIDSFLQHCRYEKNLSEKTIYFYNLDLIQFKSFVFNNSYPDVIQEINKHHLKHYLREISGWKIKTVKRKIASLKAMFNYLEFEDIISVNPIRRIRISLKEAICLPKALNKEEVKAILNEAYNSISYVPKSKYAYLEKIRNATVVELLFSTGARVSEIANLKLADLDRKSGSLMLRGKGNKERVIQICNAGALALIEIYICLFEDKIIASGGYLLINRFENKLSDQSIRNMVNAISVKAKISKKVTPHTFRHSFATLLLENDVDIKYIQAMLGHSSIVTTQIYTQVNQEKQKQILTDKHPRMDFSLAVA
ncbi:tyrosine-type recombinase/integrase [Mucilaginibacter ginsenosidivorax]|uniref:Tyrosine-type recombinase/integrase n=1 Tax=Mucilaginibacter ginsenosidivorax TaxID=862126 RepID=A0A5B8W340_9SPHI|nr:tyrosine-type recombinase/integrase [Mucilaginibacter ginsenosidivorax]QEC77286.1 tyrosine-type recombinase/integrase [Mucilaginibacter ginsenosidivorax]